MSSLKTFLIDLQSKGRYVFSKEEFSQKFEISDAYAYLALSREAKKESVKSIGKGLYIIIPPEYKAMGAPPPDWYMHELMQKHACHYYAGLLTAATYYGASHQAPQIFQVICNKQLPPAVVGRSKICFYYSKFIKQLPYHTVNTQTGIMHISTPEGTAFDLVKYIKQSGHINHVATVLSELGERIKVKELVKYAQLYPLAYSQRLGYILDFVGWSKKTVHLFSFVTKAKVRFVPLTGNETDTPLKNDKWKLMVDVNLEPDIL